MSSAIKLERKALFYYGRALAHFQFKQLEQAIADSSDAIQLEPTTSQYHRDRCAYRALANRELQDALLDCAAALKLDPKVASAYGARALIYLRLRRFDEAITDADTALNLGKSGAGPLFVRGLAKISKGDVAGGNADIATAKSLNTKIDEFYANHGVQPN